MSFVNLQGFNGANLYQSAALGERLTAETTAPVPSGTSGPRGFELLGELARSAVDGFSQVNAMRAEVDIAKLNNQLRVATAKRSAEVARQAIAAGNAPNGPIIIRDDGTLAPGAISTPERIGIYARQAVEDFQTVPEFRNATLIVGGGLLLLALVVMNR